MLNVQTFLLTISSYIQWSASNEESKETGPERLARHKARKTSAFFFDCARNLRMCVYVM